MFYDWPNCDSVFDQQCEFVMIDGELVTNDYCTNSDWHAYAKMYIQRLKSGQTIQNVLDSKMLYEMFDQDQTLSNIFQTEILVQHGVTNIGLPMLYLTKFVLPETRLLVKKLNFSISKLNSMRCVSSHKNN